jgi:hypothetical protein
MHDTYSMPPPYSRSTHAMAAILAPVPVQSQHHCQHVQNAGYNSGPNRTAGFTIPPNGPGAPRAPDRCTDRPTNASTEAEVAHCPKAHRGKSAVHEQHKPEDANPRARGTGQSHPTRPDPRNTSTRMTVDELSRACRMPADLDQ